MRYDRQDRVTDYCVPKRTANTTQPQMAVEIEARTRREYPHGIQAYGTDALRFAFCAMASRGRDLAFDLKRIEGYRNFCNKLWNAAKFVLMHAGDPASAEPSATELGLADRWIRSLAGKLIATTERGIAGYRFDVYANALYEFAWHEFCDWYVELTKPILFDESASAVQLRATRHTLRAVLDTLLRIAHPIIPFITETLAKQVSPDAGTIMRQPFPTADDFAEDPDAEAAIDWLKSVVTGVRNIRGEMNVSPAQQIDLLLQGGEPQDRGRLDETESLLRHLAKVGSLRWLDDGEKPPPVSVQVVANLKVMVPMAGLIDVDAETKRVTKEIDKLTNELKRVDGKLGNASFLSKAPAVVVAKERDKGKALGNQLDVLAAQLATLKTI